MTTIEKTASKGAGRREFVTRLGAASLGVAAGALIAGCGGSSSSAIGSTGGDQNILNTAVTAEALSAVMYYNIINGAVYQSLSSNTLAQAALVASFEQEIVHYNYLITQGATPLETTFYFPTNMFTDPQITLNTLITVKDTMIAAYLFGIGNFSTSTLRVIAGQISGAESEQRALGRVAASSLSLSSVSGLAGSESVTAPTSAVNNLAFERTFSSAFPDIAHVVTALGPFTTPGSTGYGTTSFTYASVSGSASAGKTAVTLSAVTP
ncbi:MAG: ferritin-like domain-containing protein [Janthinobacterium lividum]